MIIAEQSTIALAWVDATEKLMARGGDAFTGIVHVEEPKNPVGIDAEVRSLLDEWLDSKGLHDTQTVANTIFPEFLAKYDDEAEAYERYRTRIWPKLRRMAGNAHGTYFLRLIGDGTPQLHGGEALNPLDVVIKKLRSQIASRGPMRSVYELPVYSLLDRNLTRGFPCLSHVSLKLDDDMLHLTGVYRNQCYVQRLFGNLLGLARLQAFVAAKTGLKPGRLVCHATHAELATNGGLGSFRDMVKRCRELIDG